jgi:hypothetical protein
MNIFLLDTNPRKCAAYHCDRHVVKMILESAQMLCTAHWMTGSRAPYKATHTSHPCSLWVRESIDNYRFLCRLGLGLCKEYTRRYGKVHKTQNVIEWCNANEPALLSRGRTPFAQAMPEEYKGSNAIEAYRRYYLGEKRGLLKYTNSRVPKWIKNAFCV